MSSLFLLNASWVETPSLADPLRREQAGGDALVLPLDFWAGKQLREASIPYVLPRDYFDAALGRELDVRAAELARTWHEGLDDRLEYKGISLGQMAEYDFTFLFIDALRSVEIAHRLFDESSPNQVFLSRQPLSRSPNAVFYESLPNVVAQFARQGNLPVTWSGPADYPGPLPTWRERTRDTVLNRVANLRTLIHSWRSERAVLFTDTASDARIAASLEGLGLSSLSVPPARRALGKARTRARALQMLWQELRGDPDFREALTYRDIPLSEILEGRFRRYFAETVPHLIEIIEGAGWLMRRLWPQLLVVAADVPPDARSLARFFRGQRLPVLVIQHGAVSVDMGGFHVMPVEGTRQAVWGGLPQEWHLRRGKPPESQVVTGNPAFDAIAQGWTAAPDVVRRRLGLDPQRGIILFATEWASGTSSVVTPEDEERFIRSTLRGLKAFPEHQTVVKLHPGYQTEYTRLVRAIAEEEGASVILAGKDLWDLLVVSDVVIIANSTVGLEALILGKPVVVVHAFEGMEAVPYVDSGAALGTEPQPEAIAATVDRALHDESVRDVLGRAREGFVRAYAFEQDGLAFERVATLIQDMIRESALPTRRDS